MKHGIILGIILAGLISMTTHAGGAGKGSHCILKYETKQGDTVYGNLTIRRYTPELAPMFRHVWGTETKPPETILVDIRLTVNNKAIDVPFSAFSDLANYRKAWIGEAEGMYVLTIQGGDASTSYTAEIRFNQFVRKRTVRHGEFPEKVWDEIRYSVNETDI